LLITVDHSFSYSILIILFSQCFLFLLELSIILCLGNAINAILPRGAKANSGRIMLTFVIGTSFFLVLTFYFIFIISSWLYYIYFGEFITYQNFNAMVGIMDIRKLVNHIWDTKDLYICLKIILLAATLSTGFILYLRFFVRVRPGAFLKDIGISFLFFIVSALVSINLAGGKELSNEIVAIKNYISPQFSILTSYLIGQFYFKAPVDNHLKLNTYESPISYAAKITGKPEKNVLLFMIEAFRADLINYRLEGKEVTPFLNKLVAENIYFQNAYSISPETGYSQESILTGVHPLKYSYRDIHVKINYPDAKIYDLLACLGYKTVYLTDEWLSSKRLTNSASLDLLYDPNMDPVKSVSNYLNSKSTQILGMKPFSNYNQDVLKLEIFKEWLNSVNGNPVFAAIYLLTTHYPYENVVDMGEPLFQIPHDMENPSFFYYPEKDRDNMWKRYLNNAHAVDSLLRDFFEYLEKNELLKNTVVIITGDHGESFYEHMQVAHCGHLFEEQVRVPLIFVGAGQMKKACSSDSRVSHLNIDPTILEIMSLPPYDGFQESSILKKSDKEDTEDCDRTIFLTNQARIMEDAVIYQNWKYSISRDDQKERLYNLSLDPKEENNLINIESDRAKSLRARLERFRNDQFYYYLNLENNNSSYFPPKLNERQ
jgi:arylsulfatase A-like enzyme